MRLANRGAQSASPAARSEYPSRFFAGRLLLTALTTFLSVTAARGSTHLALSTSSRDATPRASFRSTPDRSSEDRARGDGSVPTRHATPIAVDEGEDEEQVGLGGGVTESSRHKQHHSSGFSPADVIYACCRAKRTIHAFSRGERDGSTSSSRSLPGANEAMSRHRHHHHHGWSGNYWGGGEPQCTYEFQYIVKDCCEGDNAYRSSTFAVDLRRGVLSAGHDQASRHGKKKKKKKGGGGSYKPLANYCTWWFKEACCKAAPSPPPSPPPPSPPPSTRSPPPSPPPPTPPPSTRSPPPSPPPPIPPPSTPSPPPSPPLQSLEGVDDNTKVTFRDRIRPSMTRDPRHPKVRG